MMVDFKSEKRIGLFQSREKFNSEGKRLFKEQVDFAILQNWMPWMYSKGRTKTDGVAFYCKVLSPIPGATSKEG